jgi:hypothetical protein
MPWVPEVFSAPVLERLKEERRLDRLVTVPYFAGVMAGETEALIGSFAGEPELHHPIRGRVKGGRALAVYVDETNAWLADRNASVEELGHVITPSSGFEEVVLHLDGENGRIHLPVAIVADHRSHGRLDELRIYYSSWPLTGRHATRPPVLQPDPELHEQDIVADYQRALAAGDLDAIVSAFEPDGYARERAGGEYIHRGREALRGFYRRLFSNDGGIGLQLCNLIDEAGACALEYNVVRWGRTELLPQAGVGIYVRGESGKLAAARIYDDADPILGRPT